jgi:hypothetical protein
MQSAVTNAAAEINTRLRPLDVTDTLGLMLTTGSGSAIAYDANQTLNPNDTLPLGVGYAPWQDDWLTWSVGIAYERGWSSEMTATGVWAWKAKVVTGRFPADTSTGYNWAYNTYAMGIRDSRSSALYSSWSEIFTKNFEASVGYPGRIALGGLRHQDVSPETTMQVALVSPTSVFPAISVAVDTGITGADDAWALLDGSATTYHIADGGADLGVDAWYTAPEFAVIPRSAA